METGLDPQGRKVGLRRLRALVFNLSPNSALAYRIAELKGKDFSPEEGQEKPKKATKEEVREFFNRYVTA